MTTDATIAEICIAACADTYRDSGEILAHAVGIIPTLGARLAKLTSAPEIVLTDGVIEAPNGAHFTTCEPDYGRAEAFQKHYAASAKDPDAWKAFTERFLTGDEAAYQAAVQQFHAESKEQA